MTQKGEGDKILALSFRFFMLGYVYPILQHQRQQQKKKNKNKG
jgi:hypothetical protein